MPKRLTVLQAAREAKVSAEAIYKAIAEDRLKGRRLWGRWMIEPEELAAYIQKRKVRQEMRDGKG